ncbi:ead/Ea22-like family protein [Escherichia coli]
MSEINYQALREAAEAIKIAATPQKLLAFRMKVTPQVVLALLDERERNQQYIKRRDQENEDIALTVGRLRVELEAAKKRIAELEAEPVSQTCKLPVNTPCQDAPAHIWLQTAGVWPEDGDLSELTWCSHNQHHDDTLYVRADLVNGNSPGTPDSWISCSDRMPNEEDVLVYCSDTKEQMVGFHKGKGLFQFFYMNGVEGVCEPSHWMPPPEPPL